MIILCNVICQKLLTKILQLWVLYKLYKVKIYSYISLNLLFVLTTTINIFLIAIYIFIRIYYFEGTLGELLTVMMTTLSHMVVNMSLINKIRSFCLEVILGFFTFISFFQVFTRIIFIYYNHLQYSEKYCELYILRVNCYLFTSCLLTNSSAYGWPSWYTHFGRLLFNWYSWIEQLFIIKVKKND